MAKLFLSNRDTLLCIDVDSIALLKAEGNYTRMYYVNQHETFLSYGIGQLYEILVKTQSDTSHFVRLGRSIIVNHSYLQKIDILKQIIELSDHGRNTVRISIPKNILKSYKSSIEKSIAIKQGLKNDNR